MTREERADVMELLKSHRPFYTKKWQSNGYYPIEKLVWNEKAGEYWYIRRKGEEPRKTGWVGGLKGLLNVLTNNGFIISESEFVDTKAFTDEGHKLVGVQLY